MSTDTQSPGSDATLASGDKQPRYTAMAQWLHWVIAALIVVQFVLARLSEWAEHDGARMQQLALLANHKSVGMSILMLAVLRLLWRFGNTPPKLPSHMPNWQKLSSSGAHVALYGFLFALPVTGWLMSSAAAYSVSWFGLFSWPDLISPSVPLKDNLKFIHEWLGKALFAVALLHILAALKHHFIDKDTVLKRMATKTTVTAFVALVAVGVFTLADVSSGKPAATADTDAAAADSMSAKTEQPTATDDTAGSNESLPAWTLDTDNSVIEFTAEQAGADFTGTWQNWQADIRFDANDLAASNFDVRIEVAGVETDDNDRNSTLQDAEWFDAQSFPVVRFETQNISAQGDGFTAASTLSVKGVAQPVQFDFNVADNDGVLTLTGSARLDRLALGVGTGEWTSTEWVGQFVDVAVTVVGTAN